MCISSTVCLQALNILRARCQLRSYNSTNTSLMTTSNKRCSILNWMGGHSDADHNYSCSQGLFAIWTSWTYTLAPKLFFKTLQTSTMTSPSYGNSGARKLFTSQKNHNHNSVISRLCPNMLIFLPIIPFYNSSKSYLLF